MKIGRSSYCSQGSHVDSVPMTATPYLQSRAPTHSAAATSTARQPPHHRAGVPSSVITRRQSLPLGASQPCVPGWIAVSASTPTDRLSSSHPDGFEAYVWVEQFRKCVWNV